MFRRGARLGPKRGECGFIFTVLVAGQFPPARVTQSTGRGFTYKKYERNRMEPPIVDKEFKSLIRPLLGVERTKLETSLLAEGCRDPLVTWKGKNILLDGHNRLGICDANDVEYYVVEIDLPDRDHARLWIKENQLGRRNLTEDQQTAMLVEVVEERSKIEKKERASKGREAGGKATTEQKADRLSAKTPLKRSGEPQKRTTTEVAKEFNIPEKKLRDVAKIKQEMPEVFEQIATGETTVREAKVKLSQKRRAEKRQALERKAKKFTTENNAEQLWEIRQGDCLVELAKIPAESVRLVFADPPYNIGVNYGDGVKKDLLPAARYIEWVNKWIAACRRILTKDGSLWVMIGDEYAANYRIALSDNQFTVRSWIKWYETFGVNCANNFNRCSRHIFYAVNNPKHFVFNADAVTRPSDRQAKYNDKRASSDGKIWDNVWAIPRITGTCKERIPEFPTQYPLEIATAIVGCASEPGDTILDPFSGSATTGAAAVKLGRKYIGIELRKKFSELSITRLKGVKK